MLPQRHLPRMAPHHLPEPLGGVEVAAGGVQGGMAEQGLQRQGGGNALIGRQLYPLMVESGFDAVRVSPRMVYADATRPDLVEGFTRRPFTAMIEGARGGAIAAGITEPAAFDAGIRALYRTAEADGVFCYTFFKGVGRTTTRSGTSAPPDATRPG